MQNFKEKIKKIAIMFKISEDLHFYLEFKINIIMAKTGRKSS